MRIEPFAELWRFLPELFLVSILLEPWFFLARRCGWTPLLWLPIAAASGAMTLELLNAHPYPIALIYDWAAVLIFAGALWAFPRRWKFIPTTAGIVLTAAAAVVPFYATTELLTLQALG